MQPSGFLLINKPAGPTSHDVVDYVRNVIRDTHPSPSQEGNQLKSPPTERLSRSEGQTALPRAGETDEPMREESASSGKANPGVGSTIRVGHAGTLDPFAEGLLIIGVGRDATKQLDSFKNLAKTYKATLRLGATSDTDDRTGQVIMSNIKYQISKHDIENVLKSFVGEIEQIPPMYSAKKVKGKKLYELARKGHTIKRNSTKIRIYSIKLLQFVHNQKSRIKNLESREHEDILRSLNPEFQIPDSQTSPTHSTQQTHIPRLSLITIEVHCSTGTYIRALARDIGEKLGCGACCEALTRTAIGSFTLDQSLAIHQLNSHNWTQYLFNISNKELGMRNKGEEKHDSKFIIHNSTKTSKVLVFGTFDLLHPGHLDFFQQARAHGTYLIAGVGRDRVVETIKGKPPRQDEQTRLNAVESCNDVNEALLLPENPEERFNWIKKINPDIIALGYDQTAFTENLQNDLTAHHIRCRIVRLKPHKPEKYKSSKMDIKMDI